MSFWDYRDAVFDHVANSLLKWRADINVGSMLEPDPPSLPACFVYEIGNRRLDQYVTTNYIDEQCESTFEVQVASSAMSGASSEANAIMDKADAAMNECGFIRFYRSPVDNIDRRVYRVVARYRRLIGGGDTIPAFTSSTSQGENNG